MIGLNEGFSEGKAKGKIIGIAECEVRGKAQGEIEAMKKMALKLLQRGASTLIKLCN